MGPKKSPRSFHRHVKDSDRYGKREWRHPLTQEHLDYCKKAMSGPTDRTEGVLIYTHRWWCPVKTEQHLYIIYTCGTVLEPPKAQNQSMGLNSVHSRKLRYSQSSDINMTQDLFFIFSRRWVFERVTLPDHARSLGIPGFIALLMTTRIQSNNATPPQRCRHSSQCTPPSWGNARSEQKRHGTKNHRDVSIAFECHLRYL